MTAVARNREATLGDVVGRSGLFTDGDWIESKDQDPAGDVRLIQLADIGVGQYLNRSARFLTSQKVKELGCTLLQPGDLLVARMPDPIARACAFPGDPKPCVTAVDVCIVRPDPQIAHTTWLMWILNSRQFRSRLERFTSGSTRQRISRTNLQGVPLTIPPIAEQRRIAAILDKADAVRRKRQHAIRLTREFLGSVFFEMFGDPTTNPRRLPVAKLANVCTRITDGTHQPPEWSPSGGVPFLFVSNIVNGEINYSTTRSITERCWRVLNERCPVEPNDILYTIVGSYGNAALVRSDRPFAFQRHIAHIKPDPTDVHPEFLLGMMQAPAVRRQADRQARGVAQKTLNLRELSQFEVLRPSKAEQERYVTLRGRLETLCASHQRWADEANAFFHSLLQRAFQGRLEN